MAIVDSTALKVDGGLGWIDRYATLTKGHTNFRCGCGSPIRVEYRREHKKSALYEFTIVHRSKKRLYKSKNPDALQVFNRMTSVATYAYCTFAKRNPYL